MVEPPYPLGYHAVDGVHAAAGGAGAARAGARSCRTCESSSGATMRGVAAGRRRRDAHASTMAAAARTCGALRDRLRRRLEHRARAGRDRRWRTSASTSPGWWWTCWSTSAAWPSCRTISVQYCEPERPCTLVIGPKNHRRWEISLNDGEDPGAGGDARGHVGAAVALARRRPTANCGARRATASTRWSPTLARRPRVHRRRRRAPAAAVPGPGHVPGHPRRGQPRVEAGRGAARAGARRDALLDSYGAERKAHVRELTSAHQGVGALVCERDLAKARGARCAAAGRMRRRGEARPRQDVLPPLSAACSRSRRIRPSARCSRSRGSAEERDADGRTDRPRLAPGDREDGSVSTGEVQRRACSCCRDDLARVRRGAMASARWFHRHGCAPPSCDPTTTSVAVAAAPPVAGIAAGGRCRDNLTPGDNMKRRTFRPRPPSPPARADRAPAGAGAGAWPHKPVRGSCRSRRLRARQRGAHVGDQLAGWASRS